MTKDTDDEEDICPKCGVISSNLFGYVGDLDGKNDHYFCNLCQIGWSANDPAKFRINKEDF